MLKMRRLLFVGVLCFIAAGAYADGVNTISVAGITYDGYGLTAGDFLIQGNGLSLSQGLPDGPSFIGSCTVGSVCNLTWSPTNSAAFCSYCTGMSNGSLGSIQAQYLSPNLVFKGSAFYSGGNTLTMSFTVSGTIYGYQLVGCTDGVGCSLGPQVFGLQILGTGTETLTLTTMGGAQEIIQGASGTFTGTATPITTPEPGSMFLMATGLTGVWVRKRKASKSKALEF